MALQFLTYVIQSCHLVFKSKGADSSRLSFFLFVLFSETPNSGGSTPSNQNLLKIKHCRARPLDGTVQTPKENKQPNLKVLSNPVIIV